MTIRNLPSFVGAVTSVYTPTSGYITFAEVPGTFRNTIFEVIMSPATGTEPVDFRLMQGLPRILDAVGMGTSDLVFTYAATTYTQKTSSFTINTTKGCFTFALQVRQSTNSTDFATTVQSRWIGIS